MRLTWMCYYAEYSPALPLPKCALSCQLTQTWWPSSAATLCTAHTTSCLHVPCMHPTCALEPFAWFTPRVDPHR
jgi:hypothetical protein